MLAQVPPLAALVDGGARPAGDVGEAAIRYAVELVVTSGAASLQAGLRETSVLAGGAAKLVGDLATLTARARGDEKTLRAALYEQGYYGGRIRILVAGKEVVPQAARGRDVARDDSAGVTADPVPVRIEIETGPVFSFGRITVQTAGETKPALSEPAAYGLVSGRTARSGVVVRAMERLVEDWRIAGHPLARLVRKDVAADHERQVIDVDLAIDPGPAATYGWVNVTGASDLSPDLVARYSRLTPGRDYSARDLAKAGERLRKLEAIESVRVVPGDSLDGQGGIPITLAITERKQRFFGASAAMSTLDGGEVQAYWGHRNLFGASEKLRIEGGVSQIGNGGLPGLQYFAKAALTKPAAFDVDTDFHAEIGAVKERPETYESQSLKAKLGMVRRFSETRTGSLFVASLVAREDDVAGTRTDATVSLPGELIEDRRNNRLDATAGWRALVGIEPTYDFSEGLGFLTTRAGVSGYWAFGGSERAVLAGRLGVAGIFGADSADILPSQRLYAGGGGSVRGYAYRSIAPTIEGGAVGGSTLIEASGELRLRLTPTIGLVPFVDAASVTDGDWSATSEFKVGAGVGLRYYTGLGPIRLDVAVPVEDDIGWSSVAFYVGLGQAF